MRVRGALGWGWVGGWAGGWFGEWEAVCTAGAPQLPASRHPGARPASCRPPPCRRDGAGAPPPALGRPARAPAGHRVLAGAAQPAARPAAILSKQRGRERVGAGTARALSERRLACVRGPSAGVAACKERASQGEGESVRGGGKGSKAEGAGAGAALLAAAAGRLCARAQWSWRQGWGGVGWGVALLPLTPWWPGCRRPAPQCTACRWGPQTRRRCTAGTARWTLPPPTA